MRQITYAAAPTAAKARHGSGAECDAKFCAPARRRACRRQRHGAHFRNRWSAEPRKCEDSRTCAKAGLPSTKETVRMSSSDAAGLSRMMNAMSTPLRPDACAEREAQLTFERIPSGLQWDAGVWQRATARSAAEQCLCCSLSAQSQWAAACRQGKAAWSGLLGHSQVARSGETQHTRRQQRTSRTARCRAAFSWKRPSATISTSCCSASLP